MQASRQWLGLLSREGAPLSRGAGVPRDREGYHLCRPRLSLIISVPQINRNIISRTFNDVRTILVILASLPAVIRPIAFPRGWHRWCFWPIFEWDQSSTGTTVDALVDHLPQDSSPDGSPPACHPACEAAPTDATQKPSEAPACHSGCEGAPTDRDQPRPDRHAYLALPCCCPHWQ